MNRKVITLVLGIILLILVAGIGAGWYFSSYALQPSNPGRDIQYCIDRVYGKYPELRPWHDSLVGNGLLRDTFIVNRDGVRLHGLIVSHADSDSIRDCSLMLHGYTDCAEIMMRYYYLHYEVLGRNVILPEHFGHGLSEGDHIRMGWLDRLDILLWMDIAHQLWPEGDVLVHGLSMGGAITMMVSGEDTPDYVTAFVEDCGYTSTWDQFAYQLKDQFGLPAHPLLDLANSVTCRRFGWDFHESSAVSQLAKCTKPMLFIHGGDDHYVPTSMVYTCYEAKTQGYRELWIAPNSDHAQSIHDHWTEYCNRMQKFVQKVKAHQNSGSGQNTQVGQSSEAGQNAGSESSAEAHQNSDAKQ